MQGSPFRYVTVLEGVFSFVILFFFVSILKRKNSFNENPYLRASDSTFAKCASNVNTHSYTYYGLLWALGSVKKIFVLFFIDTE